MFILIFKLIFEFIFNFIFVLSGSKTKKVGSEYCWMDLSYISCSEVGTNSLGGRGARAKGKMGNSLYLVLGKIKPEVMPVY